MLIDQALPSLGAWTQALQDEDIPVLTQTIEKLEELREKEDDVDAHLLAPMIQKDPLMTLKVMQWASMRRPAKVVTEVESVTGALVMMGMGPFFRTMSGMTSVQARLKDHPEALRGLVRVLRRSFRASRFALSFAVHRMDAHPELVHMAALLHDFAESLLWIKAPALMHRIALMQQADPQLRTAAAQHEVLNISAPELEQALARRWRLPLGLIRITDDAHADSPSARTVMLALRLARHSALGWDNAAIPTDVHDAAELLNLAPDAAMRLVQDIDHF